MKVTFNVSGWIEMEVKSDILTDTEIIEGLSSKGDLLVSLFHNKLESIFGVPMKELGTTDICDHDLEYTLFKDIEEF